MKRVFSMLLVIAMVIAMLPQIPLTAAATEQESSAVSESELPQLTVEQPVTVNVPRRGYATVEFTAQESVIHTFRAEGGTEPYGYLYLEDGTEITDAAFPIEILLEQGVTYLLDVEFSGTASGDVTLSVATPAQLVSVYPERYEYLPNNYGEMIPVDLEDGSYTNYYVYQWWEQNFVAEFSDGSTVTFRPNSHTFAHPLTGYNYTVAYADYQNYDNRWLPGNSYTVELTVDGLSYLPQISIKEMPDLFEEQWLDVEVEYAQDAIWIPFVPEYTDTYVFTSNCTDHDSTCGKLYNSDMNELANGYKFDQFKITYALQAGELYYLMVGLYDENVGTVPVIASRVATVERIDFEPVELQPYENGSVKLSLYGNRYYHYNTDALCEQLRYTVYLSNGRSFEGSGSEVFIGGQFYTFSVSYETQVSEPWLPGSSIQFNVELNEEYYAVNGSVAAIPPMYLDEDTMVDITEPGQHVKFSFTPERTGYYTFTAISDYDAAAELHNAVYEQIASGDNSYDNSFTLYQHLLAGETYILNVHLSEAAQDQTGSFVVQVTSEVYIQDIVFDPIELDKETGGDEEYDWDTGYTYYRYNWWNFLTYTIILSDGREVSGSGTGFYVDGEYYGLGYSDNQSSTDPWQPGNTYTGTVNFNGEEYAVAVTIKGYPKLELDTPLSVTHESGENGCYLQFVPETNGVYIFTTDSGSDTLGRLYDADMNWLAGDDDSGENMNYMISRALEAGKTYYLHTAFFNSGNSGTYNVVVTKGVGVASIEAQPVALPVGTGGSYRYYTSSDDTYFRYSWYNYLEYTVTFDNGDVYTGSGLEFWHNNEYYCMEYSDGQDSSTPWEENGTYTAQVSLLGVTSDVQVTIQPLENVTVTLEDVTVTENASGYYTDVYNSETGTDERVFIYDWWNQVRIHVNYGDYENIYGGGAYYNDFHAPLQYSDADQRNDPWSAGNTYAVQTKIFGQSYTINVTVAESPVDSIVFDPVSIVENTSGWWDTYYQDGQEVSYYFYEWYYKLSYTVRLKDGTSFEASGSGFDFNDTYYDFSLSYEQGSDNQWTVGNTYTGEVSVLGNTYEVPISIVESQLQSISFDPIYLIENMDGYYTGSSSSYEDQYFYYQWGNRLAWTLQLKDGSTVRGTGTTVEYGDEKYSLSLSDNQGSENPWLVNNTYQTSAALNGKQYEIEVHVITNPVSSIEFDPIELEYKVDCHEETDSSSMQTYWRYDWEEKLTYTVTLTDGTQIRGSGASFTANGIGLTLHLYDHQSYYNTWAGGGQYYAYARFAGNNHSITVNISDIPIEELGLPVIVPNREYTLNITTPGEKLYFAFSPETTGTYTFRSFTLDGQYLDTYGHLYTSGYQQLTSDDDTGGNGCFLINTTLEAGKTYIFAARLYSSGNTGSFHVKLIQPEKITSIAVNPVTMMEGTGGDFEQTETGESFYYYRWYNQLQYTVTFENGEQCTYAGSFFEYNDSRYDLTFEDTQYSQHWQPGNTYTAAIRVADVSCPVSITIEESPVERVEVRPITLMAESRGNFSNKWDEETQSYKEIYIYNWVHALSGTVYFTDGTSTTFSGSGFEYDDQYYNITYNRDSQYAEPWQPGNSYVEQFSVAGKSDQVTISIINPVESITAEPVFVVEDTGGGKESYNSGDYFYKYYWWNHLNLTVRYKDGSEMSYRGSNVYYDDVSVTVRGIDQQGQEIWQAGNTYDATARLFGNEFPVKVSILSEVSGELGNMTWSLGAGGALKLMGQGEITWDQNYCPWSAYQSSITSVEICEGITNVPTYLFNGYNNLETVILADTVTQIGENAFSYCSNLETLECSDNLTNIGNRAFYQCVNLQEVDLGSSLVRIDSRAFYYCSNLRSIVLPGTLQMIGFRAFDGCHDLEAVEFGGTQDAWEMMLIEGENVPLYNAEKTFTGVATEVASGTVGDLAWMLNSDGVLTITGNGEMPDFTGDAPGPWTLCEVPVRKAIIGEGITSIGSYAFFNCTMLKQLNTPYGLTKIGEYAFANCCNLREAVFPPTLEEIGNYAFSECYALASIYVGKNLTKIGDYAFFNCESLYELYYDAPGSQWAKVSVGEGNEYLEDAYMYTMEEEGIVKSGVCGDALTWTINTEGVLTVSGTGAMYDYDFRSAAWGNHTEFVNKIVIEPGVTSIGNQAFADFWYVTEVQLASTVEHIGLLAFADLYALEALALPEGLVGIMDEAFTHCESLTQVTLPESLKAIGFESFAYTALTEVTIPAATDAVAHSAFYGCSELAAIHVSPDNAYYCDVDGVLFTKDMKELLTAPGGIEGGYTIPDGVESINLQAFLGCTKLTEIVIPDSVTYMGPYTFKGCVNLEKVTLGSGITAIEAGTFANTGLTSFEIPVGITYIGSGAFESCTELTQVVIPEGVTHIEDRAFADCVELVSAPLPKSLVYLGSNVFEGCGKLQSITIPDNVTEIGAFAFANCESLTEVIVPGSVQNVGAYAFRGCVNLQKVELPAGVTSIGEGAFEACVNLTEAKLPEGVTEFVYRMFAGCESLETVQIPSTVVSIGEQTFAQCTGLTEVEIPDSVKSLGNRVFAECENLQTVSFGKGVEEISNALFNDCGALKAIHVSEENPYYSSENGILFDAGKFELLRCPMAYEGEYVVPDGTKYLWENAFQGCYNLTGITVPSSVEEIGNRCFLECGTLQYADLSEAMLNWIGEATFAGCTNLADLSLPDSVRTISESAFSDCHNLISVDLPESLELLGIYAFGWCSRLQEVTLPKSLTFICEGAFYCCNSLNTVRFAGTEGQWNAVGIDPWGNENLYYAELVFGRQAQLVGLNILTLPEKLEYIRGMDLDLTGLTVEAVFDDGTTAPVVYDEVTGYDYNTVGEQVLTVHYEGVSTTFTVSVAEQPVFMGPPVENRTAPVGGNAYFEVHAENVAAYQWQYRRNAEGSWMNTSMTGCNTDTLTVSVTSGRNGYQYRCKMVGLDGKTYYSNEATLTVGDLIVEDLWVQNGPTNNSFILGAQPDFTGLAVYATFSNGTMEDVTAQCQLEELIYTQADVYPVYVHYENLTTVFEVLVLEDYALSIRIDALPEKLVYEQGQWLDITGMVVKAEMASGTEQEISDYAISGYDAEVLGEQTVTVAYENCTATFQVTVEARSASILVQPADATAMVGDNAFFTVEATDAVAYQWQYRRNANSSWFNTTMTGYKTATLTVGATVARNGYQYRCVITGANGKEIFSDAATLTVTDKPAVTGVAIAQMPDKTAYLVGRELDLSGMIVTVSYSDGTSVETKDYTVSGYDANTVGQQTITVTCEGQEVSFTVRVVGTEPETGVAYKLYLNQFNNGQTLYFAGDTESINVNYRLASTTDAAAATDVYLEEAEGGFRLYYMVGPAKTYIRVYERTDGAAGTGKGSLAIVNDAPAEVLTYDSTYKTLVYTADDGENSYYLGTYSTYSTFSVSNISYLTEENVGISQFPAMLALPGEEEPIPVKPELPAEDGAQITISEALAAGAFMSQNEFTALKYKVTGVVDEIVSDVYGNMFIADAEGNRLYIYGSYNEDGTVAYGDMSVPPIVGDTVTLYGIIGKYTNIEMKDGWIVEHTGPVRVTSQPEDVTAEYGEQVTFTVMGGFVESYQWQMSLDSGSSWIKMTDCTENTLSMYADQNGNGAMFRCVLTGTDGAQVISEPATLSTVEPVVITGISIAQMPDDMYFLGEELDTTFLDVAVHYSNGDVKYSNEFPGEFAVSGYDANTLGEQVITVTFREFTTTFTVTVRENVVEFIEIVSLPNKTEYAWGEELDLTGLQLQVTMTDESTLLVDAYTVEGYDATTVGEQTIFLRYSDMEVSFTVTVLKAVTEITKQPEAATADSGSVATFSVETEGQVVSYQWQYRSIFKWFDTSMTGYNTDTLSVTASGIRNGYDYRCMITFADGTVLYTEPAELTVNTTILINSNPNDQVVALGTKGQFSAEATGEGLQYRWYYMRPNGTTWLETTMEGCTKATVMIETTKARDGYKYRCMITDAAGNFVYTDEATMTVLSVTGQPEDAYAPIDGTAQFTVSVSAEEGFTYQWQYRRSATGTWQNTTMTGYNTATLTVAATAARNGYQYRCILTGAKNSKVYSNEATLHVSQPVEITGQPADVTAAVNDSAVFSVEATNVKSYQWEYARKGSSNWMVTGAEGNKTAQVTIPVTSNKNGYQYRCVITGMDGQTYYTNVAVLTIG